MSNIQARAPTEAVIPKYVQPKTILSLDVPSDLNHNSVTDFQIDPNYRTKVLLICISNFIDSQFLKIKSNEANSNVASLPVYL